MHSFAVTFPNTAGTTVPAVNGTHTAAVCELVYLTTGTLPDKFKKFRERV